MVAGFAEVAERKAFDCGGLQPGDGARPQNHYRSLSTRISEKRNFDQIEGNRNRHTTPVLIRALI
jgi:hypothetical protein